jgi:hypothetical protein
LPFVSTVTMAQPTPFTLSVVPPIRFTPPGPPFEIKNTLASIAWALTHLPEWEGVLGASELDQRIVFRREPPFSRCASPSSGGLAGKPVRDRDIDRIRRWFEEVGAAAHLTLARERPPPPLRPSQRPAVPFRWNRVPGARPRTPPTDTFSERNDP